MAVFCPLFTYRITNKSTYFAYEENLNSLFHLIVIFHNKFRSEIPETSTKKENGTKRCFPQRTGNSEYPQLFQCVIRFKDKGNRFF
jgi:hypothetical protein